MSSVVLARQIVEMLDLGGNSIRRTAMGVRRRRNGSDAILIGDMHHLDRFGVIVRAVVDPCDQVAVEVDQRRQAQSAPVYRYVVSKSMNGPSLIGTCREQTAGRGFLRERGTASNWMIEQQ